MEDKKSFKIGSIYFGILGLLVVSTGAAEMILGALNKTVQSSAVIFSGYFMLWRGLILVSAGLFYLSSVKDFSDIHQQAKTLVGSIMIWVIAGMQLFSTLLGATPGGEDRWFNTWDGFLSSFSPPYIPSLFLLPLTLFVLYYVYLNKEAGRIQ